MSLEKIPLHIRNLGPIILLDSCSVHKLPKSIEFKKIPLYSPFLNEVEFANNMHMSYIHSLQETFQKRMLDLEDVLWGAKKIEREKWLLEIAEKAWDLITDQQIINIHNYIQNMYLDDCINKRPIL